MPNSRAVCHLRHRTQKYIRNASEAHLMPQRPPTEQWLRMQDSISKMPMPIHSLIKISSTPTHVQALNVDTAELVSETLGQMQMPKRSIAQVQHRHSRD